MIIKKTTDKERIIKELELVIPIEQKMVLDIKKDKNMTVVSLRKKLNEKTEILIASFSSPLEADALNELLSFLKDNKKRFEIIFDEMREMTRHFGKSCDLIIGGKNSTLNGAWFSNGKIKDESLLNLKNFVSPIYHPILFQKLQCGEMLKISHDSSFNENIKKPTPFTVSLITKKREGGYKEPEKAVVLLEAKHENLLEAINMLEFELENTQKKVLEREGK